MPETEVMEPEIIIPEVSKTEETTALAKRYAKRAELALQTAIEFQVVDDASFLVAGQMRLESDANKKLAETILEKTTGGVYKAWKDLRALFGPPVELWAKVSKTCSDKRLVYERVKQAEADRILKEQQEMARKEQDRLDKLALERAARAEAKGDTERAAEILETVPTVAFPTALLEPVTPKVKGIAKQEYFWAEVTDLPALLTAVASGEIPQEAVTPNIPYLNKTAQALKHSLKWPGVTVRSEWREKGTGR